MSERTSRNVDPEEIAPAPRPGAPARAQAEELSPDRATTSWLELFYDLVLVAATIVFSNTYSHDIDWENATWLAGMFAVLWWAWFQTTELTNRDRTDSFSRRAVLLAQMFVITIFTVVGGNAVTTHSYHAADVAGVLLISVAALAHDIKRTVPELRRMATIRRNALLIGGALAIISGALPSGPQYALWAVASIIVVAPPLLPRYDDPIAKSRSDSHHLAERFGLLTMIVLGESFVKVALTASGRQLHQINYLVLAFEFLIVFAVWILYFDDVNRVGPPEANFGRKVWLLAHMPLQLSIVAMAVGLAQWETLKVSSQLTALDVRLFTTPLAGIYVVLAVIGATTPRPARGVVVGLRLATAAAVIGIGLVAWLVNAVSVELAAALDAAVVLSCAGATEWIRVHRPA